MWSLTHAGKGTLTMNPYHHDWTLVSRVAVGGLLSVLVACLDAKKSKTCISVQTGSFVSLCRTCTSLYFCLRLYYVLCVIWCVVAFV